MTGNPLTVVLIFCNHKIQLQNIYCAPSKDSNSHLNLHSHLRISTMHSKYLNAIHLVNKDYSNSSESLLGAHVYLS